jgi:hypothetical protein
MNWISPLNLTLFQWKCGRLIRRRLLEEKRPWCRPWRACVPWTRCIVRHHGKVEEERASSAWSIGGLGEVGEGRALLWTGTCRRGWSMNRNGSGAALIPRSGTSPPTVRPCSIPLSASGAALLPSVIWRRPRGFQDAMPAALGLGGGCCLPADGELLKAADCRAAADGWRWEGERRREDFSLKLGYLERLYMCGGFFCKTLFILTRIT